MKVFINRPGGRLEGRFYPGARRSPPAALVLHPDPKLGGNMHNSVVLGLYRLLAAHGFAVLRFNFGVRKNRLYQFDNGEGALTDAIQALEWMQENLQDSQEYWVVGHSLGAWVGMQLLMRRPELTRFVSIAPPAGKRDFAFLAPCPRSGLIVAAENDKFVERNDTERLVAKLRAQQGITIDYGVIDGSDHGFTGGVDSLLKTVEGYIARSRLETAA